MSCPSPSTTPRPSWGSFLSTIELVLYEMNYLYELFAFELPTHLCTASIIVFGVVFLCITINHWLGVLFNTNLCQHNAKIFIYSKPDGIFLCTGINSLPCGKNSLYRGINSLYRAIPLDTVWTSGFGLKFEFERYLAVYRGNRGSYRYRCRAVKKPWSGEPGSGSGAGNQTPLACTPWAWLAQKREPNAPYASLLCSCRLWIMSLQRSTLQAVNKKFPDKYNDLFHFLTIDTTENLCCQFEISTVCITMANQLAFFFAKISDNTDNWSFLISYIFYLKSKLHWWSLFKNKADMKRRIPSAALVHCNVDWTQGEAV
jgi:hypothetical protein